MKRAIIIIGLISFLFIQFSFTPKETRDTFRDSSCINYTNIQTQKALVLSLEETLEINKQKIQVPFIGNSFIGFTQAVGFKESRNRYHIINKFGYLGKYQFGKSTLRRLKIHNVENFLKNPNQQEKAFKALCSLNKYILRKDIERSVGKKINNVLITESGILAAAHLSGAGNVKKFLRTAGNDNKSDAFGTSVQNYMVLFSGYDVSSIKANKNPTI